MAFCRIFVYKYFALEMNKSVLNQTQVCQLHSKTPIAQNLPFYLCKCHWRDSNPQTEDHELIVLPLLNQLQLQCFKSLMFCCSISLPLSVVFEYACWRVFVLGGIRVCVRVFQYVYMQVSVCFCILLCLCVILCL